MCCEFPKKPVRKPWGFPRVSGDRARVTENQKSEINDSCFRMFLKLHGVYDPKKVSNTLLNCISHVDFLHGNIMLNPWFLVMLLLDQCKDRNRTGNSMWSSGCRSKEKSS